MAKSIVSILFTTDSVELALKDGVATTANSRGFITVGVDGSGNAQFILVDTTGRQVFVGAGVAGTPAGGVLTVQGDPAGTAIPVSAVSLPLPMGAATETTLASRLAEATFTARINTLGQKAMAASTPVVLASDQSAIPITDDGGSLTVDGTVTANQGNQGSHAQRWMIGLSDGSAFISPALDRTTAGAPFSFRLSDGTSFYDGTKTGQLPAALVGGRLDVVIGAALPAGTNNIGGVDVLTVPAPLSTTGGGTEATALRVTIANDSTGLVSVDDNGGSLTVDTPQLPAALVGGRLDTNIGAWLGATTPTVGQKAMAASIPITFASDQTPLPASQSGTWTVQQGTPPWSVTGTATDNSTNSTVKLPVLPARANAAAPSWTEGNQAPLSVLLAGQLRTDITSWLGSTAPTVGQKTMANSVPVTLASNQAAIPVTIASSSGIATTIISQGNLASNATKFTEYVVPGAVSLKLTSFYTGGVAVTAATGSIRSALLIHDDTAVAFVLNGDFETAPEVAAWAAVTGTFTAPTPDSNGTQFVTGTKSMRWTYSSSTTALERRQTFSPAQDITGYRYIRVRFFNDAAADTTRTITVTLTSGTATRSYSLTGTLGSAPFTSNTWIVLECDLDNPTSTTGAAFDPYVVTALSLKMQDGANKTGTVYWDTVRFEDSILPKHRIFSADGSTVSVITAPESYVTGTKFYLRTKNTSNTTIEFATVATGVLE
jgi:hypothetical protein